MRSYIILFAIYFIYSTSSVWGEQLIVGRIVYIDQKNGLIAITLVNNHADSAKKNNTTASTTLPSVSTSDDNPSVLCILFDQIHVPCRAVPGALIRIWGDYGKEPGVFTANQIRPLDPTGVRRRLGRGGGHGRGPGLGGGRNRGMRGGQKGHHGR